MEKAKLNNQVVSMRKYVKQAKVHIINKLVKQIKFFQNRKGSEAQIEKAKRKAERFLETVALVKKIKPDDISKLALSKTKDWKDVLQKKNSTLDDRCIAMLANYEAVQKEVENFYNANTELILKISDYFTQWEEKNKLSKDSPEPNKISLKKNIPKATLKDESNKESKYEPIAETKTESDVEKADTVLKMFFEDEKIDSDSNVNDKEKTSIILKSNNNKKHINTEKIQDLSDDENNLMETEELDNNDDESESDESDEKEIIDNSLDNNEKETKDYNEEKSSINKIHKFVSKSDTYFKMNNHASNKLKAIALLNLNELEGLDEIPVTSVENDLCGQNKSSDVEINETFQSKSTDPFFLGHNEDDSNAKESSDSDDSDVNLKTKDYAQSFNHRTKTVKSGSPYRKDYQFSPKKIFQKSTCDHKSFSRSFKNEKDYEKSFKRDNFPSKNYHNKFQEKYANNNKKDFKLKNKLHPPTDMFGKKQFRNTSKCYGDKDNSLRNKMPYEKGNANEPLHPSWAAKRKQKELLSTSFQGKRMVFND